MTRTPAVAFLGTGRTDLPMAMNLARPGFPLRVLNRGADRASPLAATPAEAAVYARDRDAMTGPGGKAPGGKVPGGKAPAGRRPAGRRPTGRRPAGRHPAGRRRARSRRCCSC